MVTFTINIPQMLAYIPYMDPLGNIYWLVVEPYPSEKYEFVSWDDEIPNIWKNKKYSKPPTRYYIYV